MYINIRIYATSTGFWSPFMFEKSPKDIICKGGRNR